VSIFSNFPKKSLYEVSQILVKARHESILNFIDEDDDDNYWLNTSIGSISSISAYQFAVACSLASLGNPKEAERIFKNPESVTEPDKGDTVSRKLFDAFMS